MRRSFTTVAASVAVLGALALAGCSDPGAPVETPEPSQSIEAVPANPGVPTSTGTATEAPVSEETDLQAGVLDQGQAQAVSAYLLVRENAESAKFPNRPAWEAALQGVTTPAGFAQVSPTFGPAERSHAQTVARDGGYHVKVTVGACILLPGYGTGNPNSVAVKCPLTDIVTDAAGTLTATQNVDSMYPYFGPRDPAVIILANVGGKWLVDGDYTGLAG